MRWLALLFSIGWLGFMAVEHTRAVTERSAWIRDCEEADTCAGRRVFLALVQVRRVEAEAYVVRKLEAEHSIVGDARDLKEGETVSVVARWEDGLLVEQELTRHPWREEKAALGVLGLILTSLLLLGGFRWKGGLVARG